MGRCSRITRCTRVWVGRAFWGEGDRCPRISRGARVGGGRRALGTICVLGAFQEICEVSLKRV